MALCPVKVTHEKIKTSLKTALQLLLGTSDSHVQRVTTLIQECITALSSASSRKFENPDFDNGVTP